MKVLDLHKRAFVIWQYTDFFGQQKYAFRYISR